MTSDLICHRCGGEAFRTETKGPHIGIYCRKCGTWKKWIKMSELKVSNWPAFAPIEEVPEPSPYDGDYYDGDEVPWE